MADPIRPIVYGALAFISIGAMWWSGSKPPIAPKISSNNPAPRKLAATDWNFSESEMALRFEKPKGRLRNVFHALVYSQSPETKADEEQQMKVPASLADGEGDWAYTGMVEVDGVKMALLENGSTHQGGYVRQGENWKKSRIVSITMAFIRVAGPDGTESSVYRYIANQTPKPKPMPDPGFRPMDVNPALKGPIGLKIRSESGAGTPAAAPPEDRKIKP